MIKKAAYVAFFTPNLTYKVNWYLTPLTLTVSLF